MFMRHATRNAEKSNVFAALDSTEVKHWNIRKAT